jgi:hypothetical protein
MRRQIMTEASKPKIELVGKAEHNPSSVFDDLSGLRKAQKLSVQRKTITVNVAVDRPANNCFFRAHPEWELDEATIIKDDRTYYFVVPSMRSHPKIAPRLRRVTLVAISLWPADTIMIWPVPFLSGGREFKAWKSARAAFDLAHDHWVQIAWDEIKSDYVVETAEGIDHSPVWPPDKTFEDLLKLAFDGKILDHEDHPYVRQLRGIVD